MQRTIEISFKGIDSSFKLCRIERSKLYGNRRRIPVDASGRECSYASLTIDGRFILPPGSTSRLYVDEKGEVVERNRLQAAASNGNVIANLNASEGIVEISEDIHPVTELLDYTMTHAYALEPVFISPELSAALSQGDIYHLPGFNDNGSRQAILLGADTGYFILFGQPTGFKFTGLAEADLSPPDMGDERLEEAGFTDDLDFAMY